MYTIIIAFCVFASSFFLSGWRFDIYIGLMISGIVIFPFAFIFPKKSAQGRDAVWKVKGLKDYINTAERYRVKFYEQQNIFEIVLPFAIAFNLGDKWMKAFDGILKKNPDWYDSPEVFSWSAWHSSFNSLTSSIGTSVATHDSSGSGGGGSSGGGGGGGGGGSW